MRIKPKKKYIWTNRMVSSKCWQPETGETNPQLVKLTRASHILSIWVRRDLPISGAQMAWQNNALSIWSEMHTGKTHTLNKAIFNTTGWLLLWGFSHLTAGFFLVSCCLYLSLCSEYRIRSVCPCLFLHQSKQQPSPVLSGATPELLIL